MSSFTGVRGSLKRRFVLFGIFTLGTAVLVIAGFMAEASAKQVYWAVYSRLHPMRDGAETYAFSQAKAGSERIDDKLAATTSVASSLTQDTPIQRDPDAEGTAAAGDKPLVTLLPATKEDIKHVDHEQNAAREAHQRVANVQEEKEEEHMQDLAEQQLAKATAAYSDEIEAVAGREEASRLTDKLAIDLEGPTHLEQETAASTAKQGSIDAKTRLHQLHNLLWPSKRKASRQAGGRAMLAAEHDSSEPQPHHRASRKSKNRVAKMSLEEMPQAEEESHSAADESSKQHSGAQVHHRIYHKHSLVNGHADAGHAREVQAGGDDSAAREPMKRVREWSGDASEFQLTKERAEGYAKDGVLLLTWANHQYLDFALNWVSHMRRLGITHYMIGAMDNDLLKDLVEMGVDNAFGMNSALEQADLSWGSPLFFKMGREKIQLVERVVGFGLDVFISDIDTVWLKDPVPYVAKFPEADVLTSTDTLANTSDTDALESFLQAGAAFNIGIILMRKTTLEFVQEWNKVLAADDLYWDQNAFNDLLRRRFEFLKDRDDNLFRGYGGKLLVGILPVALYANGHTYYVQTLAEKMHLQPYVVHNTFQFSGTDGKRHRFRENQLWLVDGPEYYDPPGGLLSFDFRLDHLLEPITHMQLSGKLEDLLPHFDLVNAQLAQLRNALVLATALRRTLVLPRMIVGLDRWWAPHKGLIPGTRGMRPPLFVPADHVLDLHEMSVEGDEAAIGPPTPFREYSFFDNPRVPENVTKSRLTVQICKSFERGCTSTPSHLVMGASGLRLQHGLTDQELKPIFQALESTKVLHFDDLSSGIAGFQSQEDLGKFQRRTKVYTSIWCCVDEHPGHVWYDMWWDHPGHRDRHNRKFEKWEPLTGP